MADTIVRGGTYEMAETKIVDNKFSTYFGGIKGGGLSLCLKIPFKTLKLRWHCLVACALHHSPRCSPPHPLPLSLPLCLWVILSLVIIVCIPFSLLHVVVVIIAHPPSTVYPSAHLIVGCVVSPSSLPVLPTGASHPSHTSPTSAHLLG
jgi:hypothetical protein